MEDYLWILLIIGIAVIWVIIAWIIETISNSKKYLELKPRLDNLENSIKEHESKVKKDREEHEFKVEKDRKEWEKRVEAIS